MKEVPESCFGSGCLALSKCLCHHEALTFQSTSFLKHLGSQWGSLERHIDLKTLTFNSRSKGFFHDIVLTDLFYRSL